ncbi:hypothetical protein L9F63_020206 [Diploptera punctata]|uniref:Uncharacterized protein n=1 Tax=Diploptera punctata TaxID=6984 RepID=A0AAD8ED60_DIPPU|nr:hypothetical protein L9F63_020206 [Diploptera punctata]
MSSLLEEDMVHCVGAISKNFFPKEGNILMTIPPEYNLTGHRIQQTNLRTKRHIQNESSICSYGINLLGFEMSRDELFQQTSYSLHTLQCDFQLDFKNNIYKDIQSKILKHIHSISAWTITVDDINSRCRHETETFDAFIFIIQGRKVKGINANDRLMSNLSFQRAKVMIIILDITSNINPVYEFLNEFSLRNSIVIYRDTSKYLKILTWPSDGCGNLKKVPVYSDCTENKYISKQIYKTTVETSDRKCKFHIAGVHNPPYSIFSIGGNLRGGIDYTLISIIANKLDIETRNITERGDSPRNRIILGHPFGYSSTNTINYMPRYYTEVYTWIVPRSASHPHWSNITKVFKFETWILIISSLIFISTTMKCINTSKKTDILKCIFISLGVFLNIPVDDISKKTTVRIIFITWVLTSVALTLIFQTFMTSYFTDPGKMHQINTFDELEQSNLLLALTPKSFYQNNIMIYTNKPKVLKYHNDCQLLNACFRNSSVAALTTEERFLYVSQLYFPEDSTSVFHKFTEEGKFT